VFGVGSPAAVQVLIIFKVPLPHVSIYPALKQASAINGLRGRELCSRNRL